MVLCCYSFVSRPLLQNPRFSTRVIIHRPFVSEKTVSILKIIPAPVESPQDISSGDIMPALLYSGRDAAQRELRRGQTKINDLYTVTGGLPTLRRFRYTRPLNVLSKAKFKRAFASRSSSVKKRRPAASAANSGFR